MADDLEFETREDAETYILARVEEAETAGDDKRLAAALALKSALFLFFNRPKDWRKWARETLPLKKTTVNKYCQIAEAEDPAAELERLRVQDREDERKKRLRAGARTKLMPDPEDADWDAIARAAIIKLDNSERLAILNWLRELLGH